MKKLTTLMLAFFCALALAGCGQSAACAVEITIPAGSREPFVFSEAEISPTGSRITISAREGMAETEVILKPVNEYLTPGYVATYLAPGVPAEFDTSKGEWFTVGIAIQNPSDTDITVCIEVKGAAVRGS